LCCRFIFSLLKPQGCRLFIGALAGLGFFFFGTTARGLFFGLSPCLCFRLSFGFSFGALSFLFISAPARLRFGTQSFLLLGAFLLRLRFGGLLRFDLSLLPLSFGALSFLFGETRSLFSLTPRFIFLCLKPSCFHLCGSALSLFFGLPERNGFCRAFLFLFLFSLSCGFFLLLINYRRGFGCGLADFFYGLFLRLGFLFDRQGLLLKEHDKFGFIRYERIA
jgi:hypothetical protein